MSKKTGDYPIPFDRDGNQLGWASTDANTPCTHTNATSFPEPGVCCGCYHRRVEWKKNEAFDDTLTYTTYYRGRSAAGMVMKRETGESVEVFMTDFSDMIPHMMRGKVSGTFIFTKRGQNYGCKLVSPSGPKPPFG